jgi:NAD+ synthase
LVKYGDGSVDVKTIGHLYKSQVYQLAEHLGVPDEIRCRPPASDMHSPPCDQEGFVRLPFETMDVLWYAQEHQVSASEATRAMGLTEAQVHRAFADFARKRRTTDYVRMPPVAIE